MKSKKLFKGIFNWNGEIKTFYRYASTKEQAKSIFARVLSKEYGYIPYFIRNKLGKGIDYTIMEE